MHKALNGNTVNDVYTSMTLTIEIQLVKEDESKGISVKDIDRELTTGMSKVRNVRDIFTFEITNLIGKEETF